MEYEHNVGANPCGRPKQNDVSPTPWAHSGHDAVSHGYAVG